MPDIARLAWISIGVTTGLMTLAVLAVALRFLARKKRNLPYEIDDWVTLLALFLLGTMFVTWTLYGALFKEGVHIVDLTPDEIVLNFKALFAVQLTYTFTVPTVKISILLFYRRIFVTPKFRIASMILIGMCISWFIAIFLLDIFQCNPVQRQWNRTLPGTCINDQPSFVANGVTNVIIDFATLLLPMPVIWKLHRSWQDRVALMGIFALGGFVCVTGIVRTIFLSTFDEADAPYTNVPGAIWSFVEPAVGLVCGSLPTMRVFLPLFSLQSLRDIGRSSYGSSNKTPTADADQTWPRSYEMMHGDNVPLKDTGTDNIILAERGEANEGRNVNGTHKIDTSRAISVQKEIIVT